jgi:hypothetical protein
MKTSVPVMRRFLKRRNQTRRKRPPMYLVLVEPMTEKTRSKRSRCENRRFATGESEEDGDLCTGRRIKNVKTEWKKKGNPRLRSDEYFFSHFPPSVRRSKTGWDHRYRSISAPRHRDFQCTRRRCSSRCPSQARTVLPTRFRSRIRPSGPRDVSGKSKTDWDHQYVTLAVWDRDHRVPARFRSHIRPSGPRGVSGKRGTDWDHRIRPILTTSHQDL